MIALAVGVAWLGERLTPLALTGCAAVLAGTVLLNRPAPLANRRPPWPHPPFGATPRAARAPGR